MVATKYKVRALLETAPARVNGGYPMTEPQYTPARLCAAPGCLRPTREARSYCVMHGSRLQRTGSLDLPPKPTDDERFDAKIQHGDGCWLWMAAIADWRHGNFSLWRDKKKVTVLAHRYAYERAYGRIPDGFVVRHRCDNPPCVRPDHLILGTLADNTHDAQERGRLAAGERHPGSRLTVADVREIRRLRADEDWHYPRIAAQYGITKSNARRICARLTWQSVPGEG